MEDDFRIVHTCGICEEICEVENFKSHSCLEGYNNYMIDENTLYFYPVLDDGTTIIRRSEINNQEKIVAEPFQQVRTSTTLNKTKTSKRTSKFNFDDEETLILEVQNRPSLWNYSLSLRERNGKLKKQCWEEIAQIFNGKFSTEELKIRFKSLHDTYRKIIHSEHQASGSARQDITKKWSHYASMQYLRDSCLYKTTMSNIGINERIHNPSSANDDEDKLESIQTGIGKDSTERRKKPRKEETTNAIERIADAICQPNDFLLPSPPMPDEIDSFLSTVGHRLRRMSPRVQLDLMQEIFDITYRALISKNA
ncbi:uncharacterized protein LOC118647022 isoform X2 [Monomorium pharaonis]|uniref:uncharacterized protein LOC118647022 isoform X2 n=1 Tax=Monomorium pharaonis TaxID=307658 RepID=UPI001746F2F8|nr:uncharacterized protein LOC118647022 isoform X2 [Monomorium pharaonis]